MHTQMVDCLLTIQGYTFLGTNAYEVYFAETCSHELLMY